MDQAFGHWNGPVDPETHEFVYVPIPDDGPFQRGMATPYALVRGAVAAFGASRMCATTVELPAALCDRHMHLDPDFAQLSYGDNGLRRGKTIASFEPGDLLVFYAGLRPCRSSADRLVYAIIGLYRIAEVVRLADVPRRRWRENAHTRRLDHHADDVIVRAVPGTSGRLERCLPIGEWRGGAYRVRQDLLDVWGDLSCKDGFIQRSAVPPIFRDPVRFLRWFERQHARLIATNNPERADGSDVIIVMLRRPRKNDPRRDPYFELGSFGLTGCHKENLLADTSAAGKRLAFVQGGPSGFRLVMLTPVVDVRDLGGCREAFWSRAGMSLKYDHAPVVIDNAGGALRGLQDLLAGVQRPTWEARFASTFRSRKRPVTRALAKAITEVWTAATRNPEARATHYWQSLPKRPDAIDEDRVASHRALCDKATGSVVRAVPKKCPPSTC